MSKIIDGKKIAKEIETELTSQVSLMSVPLSFQSFKLVTIQLQPHTLQS